MYKNLLLLAGLVVLVLSWCSYSFSDLLQKILFTIGLVTVGVPHGAADKLVATKTSSHTNGNFTTRNFTITYCGQILLFTIFFYLLPHLAILTFLLMAAYHFGETDLHDSHSDLYLDKLLILNYGLIILGVILLPNFASVEGSLVELNPEGRGAEIIHWIADHNNLILIYTFAVFGIMLCLSYLFYKRQPIGGWKESVQQLILLLILYKLPLLLSFTFYFIIWHSVSSLSNMIKYLLEEGFYTSRTIAKEIIKNSLIVLLGICVCGFIALYFNQGNYILYAIIVLAALTGPHMHVLHHMYQSKYSTR